MRSGLRVAVEGSRRPQVLYGTAQGHSGFRVSIYLEQLYYMGYRQRISYIAKASYVPSDNDPLKPNLDSSSYLDPKVGKIPAQHLPEIA